MPRTPTHDYAARRPPSLTAAAHESPAVMTVPLVLLAVFALLLGFLGTPAWPWFQSFLDGDSAAVQLRRASSSPACCRSCCSPRSSSSRPRPRLVVLRPQADRSRRSSRRRSAVLQPPIFTVLGHAFYVDALYGATFIRLNTLCCQALRLVRPLGLERRRPDPSPTSSLASPGSTTSSTHTSSTPASTKAARPSRAAASFFRCLQAGRVQSYLRIIGGALIVLRDLPAMGTRRA